MSSLFLLPRSAASKKPSTHTRHFQHNFFFFHTLFTNDNRIQVALAKELEKKFANCDVVFVLKRRILPKSNPHHHVKVNRQRIHTLTAVHEAMLHDIAFPSEVVGERLRVRVGGSKLKIV